MSHLILGSPRTPKLLFDFKAKLPKTDLTPLDDGKWGDLRWFCWSHVNKWAVDAAYLIVITSLPTSTARTTQICQRHGLKPNTSSTCLWTSLSLSGIVCGSPAIVRKRNRRYQVEWERHVDHKQRFQRVQCHMPNKCKPPQQVTPVAGEMRKI